MTRVSKKLRSFLRSIISLIQGNGFSSLGNKVSRPIWVARRLATVSYTHLDVYKRQPLNCSVRALQRIDALVVDTASFNKIQTDVYRLSFTVKNLSGLALALPSVEVTLTDLQDQVVLRRVLSPQDLSVAADILAAGTEWPVSAAVRVVSDAATPRVVGYRVMAFYP